MTVDDFVKILLAVSGAFAIVGIAFQLMRLLGELVTSVRELNHTLDNTNILTDKLVDDYDYISTQIKSIVDGLSGFVNNVFVPLTNALGFVKKLNDLPFVGGRGKSKRKTEDKEEG
jgi:hypothetical protein